MHEDLKQIKQRIPLLEYLQRRHWTGCRVAAREEFVGLCPLHPDTRSSFYVNVRKNLFYCHGCHRGGDLIRFVELSENLSFRESLASLKQDIALAEDSEVFAKATAFFHAQLPRYSEAVEYLQNRGLRDPDLVEDLGLGSIEVP
jgi:DNA primase